MLVQRRIRHCSTVVFYAAVLFLSAWEMERNPSTHVLAQGINQPDFKLPLPSNKDWRLSTEAGTTQKYCEKYGGVGGRVYGSTPDCLHSKNSKYSLDFVDNNRQDGELTNKADVDVLAAADGDIAIAPVDGHDQCYGIGCPASYGNYVTIDHGNGYTTFYGHLKKNSIVVSTGHIKRGDKIGIMGTSGYSSGIHLHFEVRYNNQGTGQSAVLDQVIVEGRRIIDYTIGTSSPTYYRSTNDPSNNNTASYDGYHDGTECSRIFGWAIDKTQFGRRVTVEISDTSTNTLLGTATANEFRTDLHVPRIGDGSGTYAFNFTTPSSLMDGHTHIIKIEVVGSDFALVNTLQPFNSVCNPKPVAIFTLSGGGKTVGNGSSLSIPIPSDSTARVSLNGTGSSAGASGGVNFAWILQPTVSPQSKNSMLLVSTPIQNSLPAFDAQLPPGSYNVSLTTTNSAGLTDVATASVVVSSATANPPSISAVSPASLAPSVFNLTINGTGFDSAAIDQIYFGNTFVGNGAIISRSSNQIIVQESMSAATLGTYTGKVKNSDGQMSNGLPFVLTQTQNTSPSITQISPASVAPGVFDLTINGNTFDGGAIDQVFFGTQLVGSGQILSRNGSQIIVRESMSTATLGTYTVKVKNSSGQTSNGVGLTITQAHGLAPAISSMSPNPVPGAAVNQTVGVFGSNFVSGSDLKVRVTYPGGQTDLQGAQVSYISSTQLNILISVGTTGANWTAQVLNPDGQGSNVFSFSVTGTTGPRITSVSPNPMTGSNSQQTLTINGSGFSSSSTVTLRSPFQTYANLPTTSITASQIAMSVTIGTTAAQWTAEVIDHGLSSGQFAFQVIGPAAPHINSMGPNPVPGASTDQTVSIFGTGFVNGAGLKVRVNYPTGQTDLQGGQVSFVSSTQLNILINVGTGAANWTAQVINPDGTGSNVFGFSVTAAAGPHVTSVSPNPMTGSSNPQTLTINGSAFTSSSTVTLRSPFQTYTNLPTTSIIATQIVMQVTIGTAAAQWTVEVIDHGVSSGQFAFQVVAPPAPQINSVSPNPVTGSSSSQTFTVSGTGFTSNSTVTLRSPFQTYPNQPTSSITSTQISMPVTFGTTAAQWTVEVIDQGQSSGQFAFQVVTPASHINSMSPNPVPGSSSDQIVSVFGTGFLSGSGLKVRVTYPSGQTDLQGGQVTWVNSTQLNILINVGTGAANWTAQAFNPGDTVGSNIFQFSVTGLPAPHINNVSPNPVTGSNSVQTFTVNGSGFSSNSTVTLRSPFQTYSNQPINSITATQIVIPVTFGTTAAQWTVEVIDHGVSSGQFAFQVVAPPAPHINSVSPNPVTGSNSVQTFTVNGSGFSSNSTVTLRSPFQTYPNQPTNSITATQIVIPVTFGTTAAQWTVEVIDQGQSSGQFAFQVVAPPRPSISSISPNPVPTFNANQNVQVFGSSFQSGLTVDVFNSGGTKISTLSGSQVFGVSATSFTMVVNLGSAASSFGIEVVNPDSTRSSRFTFSTTANNPSVSSISPNPVPVFNGNQTVQVFGGSFQSGLTVDVFNSSGTKVGTLSGSGQIQSVSPSSFTMVINLGGSASSFGIEVVNPNGGRSSRFTFSY